MHLRFALMFAAAAIGAGSFGCSSGLGNNLPQRPPAESGTNANLPLGIDLGVVPQGGVGEHQVTGVVVPAIGAQPARDLVLLAFTTAAPANNADGAGNALSRDAVGDANTASDVFVAAVSARDVETRAFSQSLAGKFRHPRCATCHSMQAAGTLAFASASQPHAGPLPGPGFPNNDPATCNPCHVSSTQFPVLGWQAPAASFDLRSKSVLQLAQAARNVPADETEHFVTDPRVLWALDSGVLPQVGGRNGIADDDHDGIAEPEDEDGVIRTVPGGSARFLEQIEAWIASGRVDTTAAAVRDVTLVSRANATTDAANGASTAPRLCWVANPSFNPQSAATAAASNPIGTLYVVFESLGSNLAGLDTNGVSDIYRAVVELRAEEDVDGQPLVGGLNLRYLDASTTICSARSGVLVAGNGASSRPSISGTAGQLVTFQSLATDLIVGFTDGNGAAADVYLRQIGSNVTQLLSHGVGNAATGGNGASEAPVLSSNGLFVAFESDATDLLAADGNGLRDIFWCRINSGSPFVKLRASVGAGGVEGTGGGCRAAAIHATGIDRVLVAYESDKTSLATIGAPTNVFLFDSVANTSTLLNARRSPTGDAVGNGIARTPSLSGNGELVAFVSAADNIDVLRPNDQNRAADVFLVEVGQVAAGNVLPFRASITTSEGADADGPSSAPVIGSFGSGGAFPVGLLAYGTDAGNLGTTDSTKIMVSFLAETSGVLANFTPSVVRGAVPLTVTFTDGSSGSPTGWQWDFDNDGVVDSTLQNPTHVYTVPGNFSVRLLASNSRGEGARLANDLVLAVGVPVPTFTSAPPNGVAPLSVTFTDTSTQSPTGWQWDFDNDGTIDSTVQNPTHVYTLPGVYTVRQIVSNEAGSAEATIPGVAEAFTPVVAGFTRTPANGIVPFNVTFTNASVGAVSYAWDFDEDGLVDSNAVNPVFNYTVAGVYNVTLTATGPGGSDVFTFTNCVTANGAVAASFTMTVGGSPITSAYTGTAIQFTSTSTGTITGFAWDFDNNPLTTESTLQNPTRSFANSSVQVFTIRLTVTGPGGTSFATRALTSVPATESVTFEPQRDSTIYSDNVGNGNGQGQIFVSGRTASTNAFRRALIEFDIAGNVPSGSTINSASLRLTHLEPPGVSFTPVGNQTLTLRRLTQSWTEGSTANNTSPGIGSAATGGDVTWNSRTSPATAWTNPGGTFSGLSSGSTVVGDAYTNYTWTVTTSVVQNMLDTPSGNHGWALIGNEVNNRTVKWFGSGENPVSNSRPKLTVNFTRPLP
jgi:PKD repeat protein